MSRQHIASDLIVTDSIRKSVVETKVSGDRLAIH